MENRIQITGSGLERGSDKYMENAHLCLMLLGKKAHSHLITEFGLKKCLPNRVGLENNNLQRTGFGLEKFKFQINHLFHL